MKSSFETWDAPFGVKIGKYHDDNIIFSGQPFRSEIEDENQTKTFLELDLIIKIPLLKEKIKL